MPRNTEVFRRELVKLATLPIADLRRGYRKYFRTDPPDCFGHDLLRRAIAHAIEEKIHGTVLPRELDRALRMLAATEQGKQPAPKVARTTLMRMQPGTEFVRVWQGTAYRVVVAKDGFHWNGATWKSLSEIARAITGTRWNGPRFFGLREDHAPAGKRPLPGPQKPAKAVLPSPAIPPVQDASKLQEVRHG